MVRMIFAIISRDVKPQTEQRHQMNKKTKEEKEMKRPGVEVMERFGVRSQMVHGEKEVANCDLKHGAGEAPQVLSVCLYGGWYCDVERSPSLADGDFFRTRGK